MQETFAAEMFCSQLCSGIAAASLLGCCPMYRMGEGNLCTLQVHLTKRCSQKFFLYRGPHFLNFATEFCMRITLSLELNPHVAWYVTSEHASVMVVAFETAFQQ